MPVETQILRNEWDVERRLTELGLDRQNLINVVGAAVSASADATPFHPANAAGMFAYQHGTWALRNEHVGKDWVIDRTDGVEAIRNDQTKVRIVYSNVDLACDGDQGPKPRSPKGAGAERVCNGNLFDSLPQYAPNQEDEEYTTYYLMVDERGAAELTQPVIKGRTFNAYIERIYLTDGGDALDSLSFDTDDAADDFNPEVIRK